MTATHLTLCLLLVTAILIVTTEGTPGRTFLQQLSLPLWHTLYIGQSSRVCTENTPAHNEACRRKCWDGNSKGGSCLRGECICT
ncbi:hypothetical protein J6590_079233 [Homalodisca vitripennis]|nr:hypothetical protein J6590_079233 [Homalodisca vitripennis]